MRDFNNEYKDFNQDFKYVYNFDNLMRRYMMRSFHPFIKKGTALELGCYKGEFTEILTGCFDDITVIEASSELADFTKERLGNKIKMVHSLIEDTQLEDKYDSIFLMHTLEHLDEPVEVLKKCRSWLSETGRLFLAVPNGNAASRQIAVKMGLISHNSAVTESEYSHGHRRTYTLDTLERDAKLANLKVMNKSGVFFKALANFQLDKLLQTEIIDEAYMEGCYQLGMEHPNLCASIFLVCEK